MVADNYDFDIAIIGGGIAGLTAAYEAAKISERVVLIEPGPLGGMLQTLMIDDHEIEASAHILTAKQSLKDLCAELDLSIVETSKKVRKQSFFIKGRQVSFRRNPLSLLLAGLLPPQEIMRAIKNLLRPSRRFSEIADLSVADFMTLFAGSNISNHILGPLLRGIYGASIDELSSRWIFSKLWGRLEPGPKAVHAPKGASCRIRGGNAALVAALKEAISQKVLLVADKINSISPMSPDRCGIRLAGASGTIKAKTAIWTADLEPLGQTGQSYVPITVAHISCRQLPPNLREHLGVLFAKGNKEPLLGIMCYSELFPETAPKDKSLLAFMFGGHAPLTWSDRDVMKFINDELQREFPLSEPKVIHMQPWPRAIPLYKVGHSDRVAELCQLESRNPGFFLASRITSKPGISDRIESALSAVRRCKERLQ